MPTNDFHAVGSAFSVLLGFEILGLVFVLPQSISDSVGKQLEILSIILLRDSFQEFIHFDVPLRWEKISGSLLPILADTFGALATFVVIGLFYRFQRHQPITRSKEAQHRFRATKRLLALALLVTFVSIGAQDAWGYLRHDTPSDFFDTFFTILVFSDILLIFLSLRYSSSYPVVFRNSGFALVTVFIRLSVTAPHYFNAALALGSALFVICLTLAYNGFAPPALVTLPEHAGKPVVPQGVEFAGFPGVANRQIQRDTALKVRWSRRCPGSQPPAPGGEVMREEGVRRAEVLARKIEPRTGVNGVGQLRQGAHWFAGPGVPPASLSDGPHDVAAVLGRHGARAHDEQHDGEGHRAALFLVARHEHSHQQHL